MNYSDVGMAFAAATGTIATSQWRYTAFTVDLAVAVRQPIRIELPLPRQLLLRLGGGGLPCLLQLCFLLLVPQITRSLPIARPLLLLQLPGVRR